MWNKSQSRKNVRNGNNTKILCEFEDHRIIGVERRNENRNPNSKERWNWKHSLPDNRCAYTDWK